MKKSILALTILAIIFITLPLAAQAAPLQGEEKEPFWRAEYFDNAGLQGRPKFVAFEDSITHDWGTGSPALSIPSNHFSARWTNTRHFEKGSYLFVLTVDDGARVWFDGKLILDAWSVGRKVRFKAKIFVHTGGDHEIQVAYFESTGSAIIALEVLQLGSPRDIVSSWRGEYFRNQDLEGAPAVVRQDAAINFDWSTGSPDRKITRDRFSVRWTRNTYLIKGTYKISVRHDDGMRIFVNGETIYDSWRDQSATNKTFRMHLDEGYHTFVVEYYDHLGDAVAQVNLYGENK